MGQVLGSADAPPAETVVADTPAPDAPAAIIDAPTDAPPAPGPDDPPASAPGDAPADGPADAPPDNAGIELAKRFTEISAKEAHQREQSVQLKSEREELAETREALKNFKANPLAFMKSAGVEFSDVANQILNDEKPTTEQKLQTFQDQWLADKKEQTEKAEAEKTSREEAAAASVKEQNEQIVSQAKTDIKTMIDEGGETYELIKERGAHGDVFDLITEVYQKTGKAPTFEEAAALVEKDLMEEAEAYFKSNKFKGRYQPVPEKVEQEGFDTPDKDQNYYSQQRLAEKYGGTLTNDMQGEGASAPEAVAAPEKKPAPTRYLSDEDMVSALSAKLTKRLAANKAAEGG